MIWRLRSRIGGCKAVGKEKDEWFRKLVETMSDGVVVLSRDANVTYCNNRVLELLDRNADEVLGRSAYEFIDEDFLDQFGKEFLKRSQSRRGLYEMDLEKPGWPQKSSAMLSVSDS